MLDDGGEVRRVRDMRTSIAGQDGRTLALGVLIEIGGEQPAGCHDTLTGLPNRVLMREHLTPAIARARDDDRQLVLLHAGLDGFRLVNRSLGREAGDAVLREAADRLRTALPDTAVLARPGSDEFCVLVPAAASDGEAVARATAGQITVALTEAFEVGGRSFQLGATLGASVFGDDADDEDTLLQHADAALAEAKAAQRGTLGFCDGRSSATNSSCTTSRSSASPAARSSRSRRCCDRRLRHRLLVPEPSAGDGGRHPQGRSRAAARIRDR